MIAKFAPHKVTIAAVFGILLLALLAYMVVLGPKRSRAGELEKDIAATEVEINAARAERAKQAQAPVVPAGDLSRMTKAMPDSTDMPGLMLELARVARETGITFDSITPSEPVVVSSYQKVPVSLIFQGNFYELSDFLYRLRGLVLFRDDKLHVDGRLFSVDGIDFAQGTELFPQIQATVSANAFVYGATPAAAAPPATPDPNAASAAGAP